MSSQVASKLHGDSVVNTQVSTVQLLNELSALKNVVPWTTGYN